MEDPENKPAPKLSQGQKLAIDFGPLIVFFVVNNQAGLMPATGAIMIATLVAIAASWLIARHIPTMPLVSAGLLMVFGGLTLAFDNEIFIKMKPTIVYALFAAGLAIGLAMKRNYIQVLMGSAFNLTDKGWHILAIRWIGFFICLGLLNEVVWRTVDTDTWVNVKVFGFMPLTLIFAIMQVRLIQRESVDQPAE